MREMDAAASTADELPEMLTVSEAARRLRIGRTLAYQLAARFLAGEPGGLPTIRLGGTLRVPRHALEELMRSGRVAPPDELTATVADAINDYLRDGPASGSSETAPARRRRDATNGTAQLSVLEAD
jgi:excisionase family DNA binding protein